MGDPQAQLIGLTSPPAIQRLSISPSPHPKKFSTIAWNQFKVRQFDG